MTKYGIIAFLTFCLIVALTGFITMKNQVERLIIINDSLITQLEDEQSKVAGCTDALLRANNGNELEQCYSALEKHCTPPYDIYN